MATAFDERYDPGVPPIGAGGVPPVVRKLLIANIAIGLLGLIFGNVDATAGAVETAMQWVGLDVSRWRAGFPLVPVWQLVTYGFVHSQGNPMHLLMNMLGLYFFGML